jgi:hypothetical protein
LGLAHASDIQRHNAILALKALAADRPEEVPAVPTAIVPPGQEGGFVRIEEAAAAAIPRWALGERGALEIPLHGAATAPDLLGNGIQRPALPMIAPALLVDGQPLRPPRSGAGHLPAWRVVGAQAARRRSGRRGRWGHARGVV